MLLVPKPRVLTHFYVHVCNYALISNRIIGMCSSFKKLQNVKKKLHVHIYLMAPNRLKTIIKYSKKDSKDQETIQSNTTPDPGYHMGK